jgi:hypothetical protein
MVGQSNVDRAEFKRRKLEIMPKATITQFVDVLLLMHERKSAIRKGVVDTHGTERIFNQSILKFNQVKIEKRKITTSSASYIMNGVEVLASPTV